MPDVFTVFLNKDDDDDADDRLICSGECPDLDHGVVEGRKGRGWGVGVLSLLVYYQAIICFTFYF